MIRILAIFLFALCVTFSGSAKSEVIAKAVVSEAFLKEFAKAKIHSSDDIYRVEIRELSPDERAAVSASLDKYEKIKPTVSSYCPPYYPDRLRRTGVSGSVDALLVVSSSGSVREVYLCSYTNVEFAQAAALALKMWRFKQAAHDYVVRVPIPFTLLKSVPADQQPVGAPTKSAPSEPMPAARP